MDEVRTVGRATMGERLVRLDDGATVVGFDTVADSAGAEGDDGSPDVSENAPAAEAGEKAASGNPAADE